MELLEQVNTIIQKFDNCQRDIDYMQTKAYDCDANILVLNKKKEEIIACKEYHKKAIDILYRDSIQELEELINDVMARIFWDRDLMVKMELSDSRSKSLIWYIIDRDKDIQISVRNSTGRGLRVVLSFIIQAYYVLSLGSKYLFIDEGYTFLSDEYVEKFFQFVRLLCKEKGLCLVMISHDDRFSEYADVRYSVLNGVISKWDTPGEKVLNEGIYDSNK